LLHSPEIALRTVDGDGIAVDQGKAFAGVRMGVDIDMPR
jgi:hypothetical protein